MKKIIIDYKALEIKGALKERFVEYSSRTLALARAINLNNDSMDACIKFAFTNKYYRLYLCGQQKNLRFMNENIRYIIGLEGYSMEFIQVIFENVESDIIENELYELMPRHLSAKKKLLKLKI